MPITTGDRLPDATFLTMGAEGVEPVSTQAVFGGRTVVLVGVPGAFTPVCHRDHLPGYVERAAAFKAHGVDTVAVTAVNDVFVMEAWARATDGAGRLLFLADGRADFARAVGMDCEAALPGAGIRSKRYAMLVRDGIVAVLAVEQQASRADLSSAAALLAALAVQPAPQDQAP